MTATNQISKIRGRRSRQSGVALITTLLLLLLMTALSLAMVISVRSDLLVNGYYRNTRGAFYAADSGINISRQAMINGVVGSLPAVGAAGVSPLAVDALSNVTISPTVLTAVQTSYSGNTSLTGSGKGNAANSWPEAFQLTGSTLAGTCVGDDGSNCSVFSVARKAYNYTFNYALTTVGSSGAQYGTSQKTTLTENGSFKFSATFIPAVANANFAGWGMFIDQFPPCSGTLVQGTITGPVFTNGAWTFGTGSTGYTFTDPVGSVSPTFAYQLNPCAQTAAPTDGTIAPKFLAGYNLGAPKVPLPTDSFNQKTAVLDGIGKGGSNPTAAQMAAALKNAGGNAYSGSTGVYLPYSTTGGVTTFNGGGIYVEGDAAVVLSPGAAVGAETYTITQGSTTTTITTDPTVAPNGQTTVVVGGKTTIIPGVPMQNDPLLPHVPQTMLYVNGNITALSGPHDSKGASTGPAVNDGAAVTVTGSNNVTITGDIKYKTEPVTMSATQIAGLGNDALIPGNDKGQALGIFTANGNVQLANGQASGNLEIDASVATLSAGGSGGIVNTGAAITNLNIVGGRIQNTIQNINASTRNVFFDRRFAGAFAPPWFPSTTLTLAGATTPTPSTPAVIRTQWVNQTSTY